MTNEEIAMVVVGPRMYGIDKISGKTLWEIRLPGQPSTSPAADEKHVYVGMLDGSLYAFELRKIHSLFRDGRLPEWSYQTIAWRYQTSKEITSPPVIFNTRVCMASRDGNVYAVSVDRRNLIFQFETDAGQRVGDGIGGGVGFEVSLQPGQGELHGSDPLVQHGRR